MREEHVTRAILKWLIANNWSVVCFDFPQSGTGRFLHPNGENEDKNKDSINPDIVAVKAGICIFSENKDKFYYPDYKKQNQLKTTDDYSNSISDLLKNYFVEQIFYGIGLPTSKHKQRSINSAHLVDFILGVDDDKSIQILWNPNNIMFK